MLKEQSPPPKKNLSVIIYSPSSCSKPCTGFIIMWNTTEVVLMSVSAVFVHTMNNIGSYWLSMYGQKVLKRYANCDS